MTNIDFSKPVQLRDGGEVRIYTTISKTQPVAPIVGELKTESGTGDCWTLAKWRLSGKRYSPAGEALFSWHTDLVNVPEEHVVFINIYPHNSAGVYQTSNGYFSKDDAAVGSSCRIACVKVTFKNGEGLELLDSETELQDGTADQA